MPRKVQPVPVSAAPATGGLGASWMSVLAAWSEREPWTEQSRARFVEVGERFVAVARHPFWQAG